MKLFQILAVIVLALFFCMSFGCGDDDDDDSANSDDDDDDNDDDNDDDDNDDDNDTAADPLAGIYEVSGTDATHGTYTGQVEFRPSSEKDGYEFIRLVEYDNLTFEQYDYVQTVWTGQATLVGDQVSVSISLRRSQFVSSYNSLARTDADKGELVVTGTFTLSGESLSGSYDSSESIVSATEFMTYDSESDEDPIWKDEDEFYESHAEPPSWLKKFVNLFLVDYHALEFYDDYRDQERFKRFVHYMPHFRSDFEFYRANPDALRVPNKVLDDISMVESKIRADAYKYTLSEKAAIYEADTEAPNCINEHGMIVQYEIDSNPLVHEFNYDSLLWTGTYVAGQAYRYLLTQNTDALDNLIFSLDGLIKNVEITGDPTTFGRTLRTIGTGSKEDAEKSAKYVAWNPGSGAFEGIEWRCCGNNDMLSGILYGYLTAWLVIKDMPEYQDYIDRMTATAISLTENSPVVSDSMSNPLLMNWLCYVLTDDPYWQAQYQAEFDVALRAWTLAGWGMFYIYGVSDWSGQHLNTVSMISMAIMSNITNEPMGDVILKGFLSGMNMTKAAKQALFSIAAHAFANPGPEYEENLEEAIWVLRELPAPKQDLNIDMRISDQWCASPLPSLFWKLDYFQGGRHQGLYGYPGFMRESSACMWKDNPLDYNGDEQIWRYNSADFLHAYWLGRYYGVLTGDE